MFGISKVAEGNTIPENKLPLDIDHKKLLVWLVDRKQVPQDWNKELEVLEQEIAYATKLLPDSFPPSLLNDNLWYNRMEKILQEVEKSENGWTGSSQGRAWRRVMKHAKKKNIFMAHSARVLLSLVNYEIPALNKTLERSQKHLADHRRKEAEYKRIAGEEKANFQSDCSTYGIKGECINEELSQLAYTLPTFFTTIVQTLQECSLPEIMTFYSDFVTFLGSENAEPHFQMLRYAQEFGNETISLFRKRQAGDDLSSETESFFMVDDKEMSSDGLDDEMKVGNIVWDDDVPMAPAGAIQWDVDVDVEMSKASEINWDINEETENEKETEINWDPSWEIEVEDNGIDIVEEPNAEEEDPSILKESILGYSKTRNQFLDDILELQAFLKQRISEMESKENLVLMNILQNAPKTISCHTLESVKKMESSVMKIKELLTDPHFRMIVEIKASSRFTERLCQGMKRKLDQEKRMKVLADEVHRKQEEVQENTLRVQLKRTGLIKEAVEIKNHLQHHLSSCLSRPVSITGEIQTILGL